MSDKVLLNKGLQEEGEGLGCGKLKEKLQAGEVAYENVGISQGNKRNSKEPVLLEQ